mgnify:CR=1 FL=1
MYGKLSNCGASTFVSWRKFVFAAVLGLLVPLGAQAAPILSTSGGSPFGGAARTIGWKFTTGSSALSVTHLDALFNNGVTSTNVRMYNSAQTILASATVTTSDPTVTAGLTWRSHAITPVTLAANTTYFIASDQPSNLNSFVLTSTPTMSLGVLYQGGINSLGTGGLPLTDAFGSGALGNSYFGPNFEAVTTTIPEPATLSVLLSAPGAVMLRRGRRLPRA